jgi:hypothetical protein
MDAEHTIGRFGPSVACDEWQLVLASSHSDETVVDGAPSQARFGKLP